MFLAFGMLCSMETQSFDVQQSTWAESFGGGRQVLVLRECLQLWRFGTPRNPRPSLTSSMKLAVPSQTCANRLYDYGTKHERKNSYNAVGHLGGVPVARLVIRTAKFKLRSDSGQPCFEPLALQAGFQVAGQGKRSCNQSGHVARPMPLLCRKVAGLGFDVVNWQSYPAAVEFLMTCVHQRKSFGILWPCKSFKHAPPHTTNVCMCLHVS